MKQTRKRRILIVDDSEMNREILTGILENEYDIVEAEDGKKAIAVMEEGLYSFYRTSGYYHAGAGWIRRVAGDAAT